MSDNEKLINIGVTCRSCKKEHVVTVNERRYEEWATGKGHIQDMLPELSVDERELFISQICGRCFDRMCKEE